MTRDEEIEALAMHWLRQDEPPMSRHEAQARFDTLAECAAWSVEARDRWRAARQPAPETPTPTPRIEVLKRWMECCVALNCEAKFWSGGALVTAIDGPWNRPSLSFDELDAIRQHAAALKERKEKEVGGA